MMTSSKNDDFLKALARQPVSRTPVWVMRQAGRYLPEYRALRQKAGSFMSLCQNPELACEVTLQPLARFDLDAAILFSDILTIPDALGLGLYFEEGEGPKFQHPLKDKAAVDKLPETYPDEKLKYVSDAASLISHEIKGKVPLIGFSGSPWTLACYMIQGEGSRDFAKAKQCLYQRPEMMHVLLDKLANHISQYLKSQIAAGVNAVMLFDTWGGLLTPECYQAFSLHYMTRIIDSLDKKVPVILFTKGGGQWLESMADSGTSGLGLDWTVDIGDAFNRVGDKVALQGNLDPSVLLSSPELIQQEVKKILSKVAGRPGHIFNLGHGITPEVPVENMQALVEAVHA